MMMQMEASTTIPLKNQKLIIDLPQGWSHQQNYWGIPLAFINTSKNITVAVSELVQINPSFTEIERQNYFTDYKLGRLAWLSQASGKLVKFYELEVMQKKQAVSGLVFGYVYKLDQTTFHEKSYYLTCKNVSYNLKYLIDQSQMESMDTIDAMIRGIGCL